MRIDDIGTVLKRDRCLRLTVGATGREEAAFLAELLRTLVGGGSVTVRPWTGIVTVMTFPPADPSEEGN
jgi:hypothetical protein